MNDDDHPDEAAFDDHDVDWVRELLSDARVTDPVPGDVAARLDDTLAALRAERRQSDERPEPESAVVVPLRRRLIPFLAAAAVIVVIGGAVVGQIARNGSGASDSTASSGAGGSSGSAAQPTSPDASALEHAPQAQKDAAQRLPQLAAASFNQDVARVMRGLAGTSATTTSSGSAGDDLDQLAQPDAGLTAPPVTASPRRSGARPTPAPADCPGPPGAGVVTLPATLDGTLVALVFRPPTATAQEVEAWSCDGTALLVAASVPH